MLQKNKIGIIGAGYMSNEYLRVIKENKNIECSAIFSRTKKSNNEKYKIRKVFENIDDLFHKIILMG